MPLVTLAGARSATELTWNEWSLTLIGSSAAIRRPATWGDCFTLMARWRNVGKTSVTGATHSSCKFGH